MQAQESTETRAARALAVVVSAAVLLLLLGSLRAPLIDPDEARFARTSVEMLRSGDPVVPTFEGHPRLVKPPLVHWLQTVLFQTFGIHPWLARLPAMLSTLGSLLLVAWVARRRFGNEGAAWAAAIFLTSPLVVVTGKVGTLDALLAVHVFAALALDMAEPNEAGPYRGAAVGALLGLAFLAKGPVGVILPLLAMLAGRTAASRPVVPRLRAAVSAVLAMAAVILPWGLAFLQRIGEAGVKSTLRQEVLDRYLEGTAHVQPPWFYGLVLALGFLPWAAPLALGLVRVIGDRRSPAARTALYAAAALLIGVGFLSLGKGKLPNYVLPLAPLVPLLVTWELGREIERRHESMRGSVLLTFTLAAMTLLFGAAAALPRLSPYAPIALTGSVLYGLALLVACGGLLSRSPRRVYGAAAVGAGLFLLVASATVFPRVAEERSCRTLATEVPALQSARPVVLVDVRAPSLTFYLDRVPELISLGEVPARAGRGDRPLLLVTEKDVRAVAGMGLSLRLVHRVGRWSVFEPA
ncbi:MAG TPA: glycosyltransferase family 39 protein [Candidatus Polarisedimenticolaceae bacterium]|nr:glycosyltransferase family 39 protein [Candidatus Polarisedimenticolaceae bacterium]